MNLSKKQKDLIEELIRQNPLFKGHEALMEKFCAEVYKKSYLLLDSASNINNLKNYLSKVVDTAMSLVVENFEKQEKIKLMQEDENNKQKNSGTKLFEPEPPVVPKKKKMELKTNYKELINAISDLPKAPPLDIEEPEEELPDDTINTFDDELKRSVKRNKHVALKTRAKTMPVDYNLLIDPLELYPKKQIKAHIAEQIVEILKNIDLKNPSKRFLQIFTLRHVDRYTNEEIARRLKISTSVLSKRYCEMVKYLMREI